MDHLDILTHAVVRILELMLWATTLKESKDDLFDKIKEEKRQHGLQVVARKLIFERKYRLNNSGMLYLEIKRTEIRGMPQRIIVVGGDDLATYPVTGNYLSDVAQSNPIPGSYLPAAKLVR